jgi:surfactin synthase thioesterase subunit
VRCPGLSPITVFVSASRAPSRFRGGFGELGDDRAVIEQMRALGGTDPRVFNDAELLQMALPAFRNDFRATEQYRRGTDIAVRAPLVVMTADDDPRITADEATAWCDHTSGGTALHTFHGGHFFLEQHASRVIALIKDTLRRNMPDPPF